MKRKGLIIAAAAAILFGVTGLSLRAADSKLADALENGDMAAVRALLSQKADVNAPQVDGTTALLWAARNDDAEMAKLLLAAGAKPSIANRYGVTPLVEAVNNGSAAMTEMLLKAGADPNTAMPQGDTVLMMAAKNGKTDVLKALLEKGAKANEREPWHGETALMIAAGANNAEAIRLLAAHGADVNLSATHLEFPEMKKGAAQVFSVYPAGGLTALMDAARDNSYDAAKALVESKVDLNAKQPQGFSATMMAIINGHWDLAKMLIEAGADPSDGSLPLAAEIKNLKFIRPAKVRPDQFTAKDVITTLLAKGAKPDATLAGPVPVLRNFGTNVSGPADSTALFRAAKFSDMEVLNMLLDKGADPKHKSKDDTTLIHAAIGAGLRPAMGDDADEEASAQRKIEVIKIALAKGVDINAADGQGQTPLHLAAGKGLNEVVQFLADNGAKLDTKDKRDRTALEVALGLSGKGAPNPFGRAKPQPETAKLLKKLMGLPEDWTSPLLKDEKKEESKSDEKNEEKKPVESAKAN